MYELDSTLAPLFLIGSSSFLQVTRTTIKAWMKLNFNQIGLLIAELFALERLEKFLSTNNGRIVVTTMNGSSSFLQVTRTTIKAWMSLNFCQIQQPTAELACY